MSKRNTMRLLCWSGAFLFLQACATVMPESNARWSGDPRAKPVIDALETYKQANGDYPSRLSDLKPRYLAPRVPFAERDGNKVTWALYYNRLPPGSYEMMYEDPDSEVIYRNGGAVSAKRNPLRKAPDLPQ